MDKTRRELLMAGSAAFLSTAATAPAFAATATNDTRGPRGAARDGRAAAGADPASGSTVQQGSWRDPQRSREIPWRLRMPGGDQPVALVVFSHGLGGSLDGGTEWAQAWADAGMATLHLQHAGSDRAIWASGPRGVKAAASAEQLMARGQDVQFAVSELLRLQQLGEGPWRRVRPDALGMSGHSFGAQTTLAVAGRDFQVASAPDLTESHFKAFAAFSPAAGLFSGGLKGITRPMLCLTGSLDGNPLGQERTGDYRRAVYTALPAGAKAQLWLEGADHMTFGGGGERGAGFGQRLLGRQREQAPQTLAAHHTYLIKAVTTDWWRARLLDDEEATRRLKSPKGLAAGDEWEQG
ncbi:alpha/beta hydrolase family protein [Roseateles amylovorans]|uniref:Acetylhydrolase n=1 Tax=Roseateles amylovorans TaxID=2978473 RepID=A0ABY6B206_9BURK|nr:hypothetical protein [Roseateles amylovorans]UXH78744.1 hypothetical protein N4261_02030 [Roseateles amylovorans]